MDKSNTLVARVRSELSAQPNVVEKKMFGSIAFLVNDKMCVNARKDRIMCRIAPEKHDSAIGRKGCTSVVMRGTEYRGYVHVDASSLESAQDLRYWINLALDFNKDAKSSR